jgi:hypothetical protein
MALSILLFLLSGLRCGVTALSGLSGLLRRYPLSGLR